MWNTTYLSKYKFTLKYTSLFQVIIFTNSFLSLEFSCSSNSKKLSTMKAFIFCASIFLFAAANASPYRHWGHGYRSPYGYPGLEKRSDDQGKTLLSSRNAPFGLRLQKTNPIELTHGSEIILYFYFICWSYRSDFWSVPRCNCQSYSSSYFHRWWFPWYYDCRWDVQSIIHEYTNCLS